MNTICYFSTAIGKIGLVANETAVLRLLFDGETDSEQPMERSTALLQDAGGQLLDYLAGRRRQFALPLAPTGTAHLRRIWDAVSAIPYGQTRSYRQIAAALGNPRSARVIGLANHRNPLPIFIPCHRVIGSDGQLTGYRGGLPLKQTLLELEQRHAVL